MERWNDRDAWIRFLEAEGGGRLDEAEASLGVLFQALPRPEAPAGFAGRVMARIRRRSAFARPAVRFGLAAALLVVAVGVALVAPMLPSLAALIAPSDLLSFAVDAVTALATRVAAGAALWQDAGSTARALGRALLHPAILVLIVTQFALASLALRALAALAAPKRSFRHAVS